MKEKATNELDEILKSMKPDDLNKYYKENNDYIANAKKSFSYYMKDVLARKNITLVNHKMCLKDIYSIAGVSESYGEKIMNMEKHTKNRDLIIRFCIAGRFSLDEINRALKLYTTVMDPKRLSTWSLKKTPTTKIGIMDTTIFSR